MNSNPPHEAWLWAALAVIMLAAALSIAWAEAVPVPDVSPTTPCTDRGGVLVPVGTPPEFACSLDLPPT